MGLGITEVGKVYGRSVTDFALDAVQRALSDCGLGPSDVDGIITSYGMSGAFGNVPAALGMRDLGLNVNMFAAGATASAAISVRRDRRGDRHGELRGLRPRRCPPPRPLGALGHVLRAGQKLTGLRTVAPAVGLTSPNFLLRVGGQTAHEQIRYDE